MPDLCTFDYAIIRVVPRVEREEFLNAGVLLFCSAQAFLGVRIELDHQRLSAFAPALDPLMAEEYLNTIPVVCAGGKDAGPVGRLSQRERFHWLVAPRSTIIHTSPVHCGLCINPEAALDQLFDEMVHTHTARAGGHALHKRCET
jgi:Protein of unknown function (DUF3037)